ncbi:hypothetical protein KQI52_01275 [bacterium]|nr:hypothetical protein [bacterium]
MKTRNSMIVLLVLVTLAGSCFAEAYTPPPPVPDDRAPIPKPEYEGAKDDFAEGINYEFIYSLKNTLNISRQIRLLTDTPKQALNVNAFGEVDDNSWFTNRNARHPMSLDEISRGACSGDGPDTEHTWIIKRAKAEGVTPGFHIKDARGDRYVIKFDPIGYGGLNSGADACGAKFFYAAGYNTPENYIVYFDPAILQLDPDGVSFTDSDGRKRHMTEEDLDAVLERVNILPDGRIQCLASKYIQGDLLGPFSFKGTREDDPNDFIPHHHRRELRGQKAFAVWVNHYDAKGANSMDAYVGEDGEGHVVHYMMDFGTVLGSGGRGPYPLFRGYEDEIPTGPLMRKIVTIGLDVRDYEKPDSVLYPSVGRLRNASLNPDKYRTVFPNPAYDNATDLDMYWGTKLVTSFTDEQIRAIIETGPYPAGGVDHLVNVLSERRDIIGRTYFGRVNCLDRFEMVDRDVLAFDDLWVEMGYGEADEVVYNYELQNEDGEVLSSGEFAGTELELPLIPDKLGDHRQVRVELRLKRSDEKKFGRYVQVWLEDDLAGGYRLLGVEREE